MATSMATSEVTIPSVTLNASELRYCLGIGNARQDSAEKKHSVSAFPARYPNELRENHIYAARAEFAVAKFLGLETTLGVDVYCVPDIIGTKIDVRWSRSRNHCKIKQRDIDLGRIIIGTNGTESQIEILGWLNATDAPSVGTPSDPSDGRPPCWFIHELAWERIEFLVFK